MENKYLDKIRKYGENIRKTEIRIFIKLTPGRVVTIEDSRARGRGFESSGF